MVEINMIETIIEDKLLRINISATLNLYIEVVDESYGRRINLYTKNINSIAGESLSKSIISTADQYPTGNCQLGAVGSFETICNLVLANITFGHSSLEKIKEILAGIYLLQNKNIFLFDVRPYYLENFLMKIFEEPDIILKTEYLSSSGNVLWILLIHTRSLWNIK